MPRAALLSIHARMEDTEPASWEDPSLVQVWGPRFSAYVVARQDLAVFTLGRLPDKGAPLKRAQEIATRLSAALAGGRMAQSEAARAMGAKHPNLLRYAAVTGTFVIRWDGSRQPDIWSVPSPEMDPDEARLELTRRYLQVFGPATPETFATWAGISHARGVTAFETLGTWRRAEHVLTIHPWSHLSRAQRDAVEAEAASLPLPGINRSMDIRWARD